MHFAVQNGETGVVKNNKRTGQPKPSWSKVGINLEEIAEMPKSLNEYLVGVGRSILYKIELLKKCLWSLQSMIEIH